MAKDLHTELESLAAALGGLRPDFRNAEAFYERRSEIRGRLRALAQSPVALRMVVRTVPAPVPPVPLPVAPVPHRELPRDTTIFVRLNETERVILARSIATPKPGGFQRRLRKFQALTQPDGFIPLSGDDVQWILRGAVQTLRGGYQHRLRAIFWRSLGAAAPPPPGVRRPRTPRCWKLPPGGPLEAAHFWPWPHADVRKKAEAGDSWAQRCIMHANAMRAMVDSGHAHCTAAGCRVPIAGARELGATTVAQLRVPSGMSAMGFMWCWKCARGGHRTLTRRTTAELGLLPGHPSPQ